MILESDWQFLAWVTAGGFLVATFVVWQMFRTYRRMQVADEEERREAEAASANSGSSPVETEPRPKFFKRYVPEDGSGTRRP